MLKDSVKSVLNQVIKAQTKVDRELEYLIENSLERPPNLEFGELSSNISFKLAKTLKKSPMKIAEELSIEINKFLDKKSLIVNSSSVKGYINFRFNISN